MMLDEPQEDCSFDRGHKFPFAVSEMLSAAAPEMLDLVMNDSACIDRLFTYLDTSVENRTLIGYFAGVILALLGRNANVGYQLAFAGNKFPLAALRNLRSKSIADLVFRLLFLDTSMSAHYLLERFEMLKDLLGVLGPAHTAEEHTNASGVLCDIIRQMEAKSWKLLICWLIQRPQLEILFENVLCGVETAAAASLAVLNALLSCECLCELVEINLDKVMKVIKLSENPGMEAEQPTEQETEPEDALITLLLQHLPSVLNLLEGGNACVGAVRLQVVELVDIMLRQKSPVFESLIIKERGLHRAISLFFACPLNSILHRSVEGLVHTVMEKGSEALQKYLVLELELPVQLANAALSSKGTPGNSGCGHMGHITRISNYLKGQTVPWWQPCETWQKYDSAYLAIVNSLEKMPKKEVDPEPEFDIERDMPTGEEEISLSALVTPLPPQPAADQAEEARSGEEFGTLEYWRVPMVTGELEDLD
jgi:hypothetical protein